MEDQLPEILRHRREELGLSRASLSKIIKEYGYQITGVGISHWEAGRRRVSLDDPVLLNALSMSLSIDRLTLLQARGIEIASTGRTPEARLASEIIDSLPPDERTTAIEHLKVLQKKYPKNGSHE